MSELNEEKIRVLAHQLWERDGRPEGKADDYWHAAEKLLQDEGEEDPVDDSIPIVPLTPTTRI